MAEELNQEINTSELSAAEQEATAVHEVRRTLGHLMAWRHAANLQPHEEKFFTELDLLRFLSARSGDPKAAAKMLTEHLQWRRSGEVEETCAQCVADKDAHCFFTIGVSRHDQPFIYSCVPRAKCYDVAETVGHVVSSFEKILTHPTRKFTWLCDFNGFGFSHAMQGRIGIGFALTLANHYPERLGRLVLINAPTVFDIMLAVCKPFVDSKTMSKLVSISGTPEEVCSRLEEDEFGLQPTTSAWLLETLKMKPVPGNYPPIPMEVASLQLSRVQLAMQGAEADRVEEGGQAAEAAAAAGTPTTAVAVEEATASATISSGGESSSIPTAASPTIRTEEESQATAATTTMTDEESTSISATADAVGKFSISADGDE